MMASSFGQKKIRQKGERSRIKPQKKKNVLFVFVVVSKAEKIIFKVISGSCVIFHTAATYPTGTALKR